MKNKIVIISNYYPPEIGAAANRIRNLAEGLVDNKNEVTVICPIPNYPKGKIFDGYKISFYTSEILNNVQIKRYWIFPSVSKNIFLRLFSMCSFAWSLWFSFFWLIKYRPKTIIIQSPPLFIALSGLILSKFVRCKNILNVSDLWPLSGLELGALNKGIFYTLLEKIESFNYKLANHIVTQSQESKRYIQQKIEKEVIVYRNVPIYKKFTTKIKSSEKKIRVVYAGLLGLAQGIYTLCEQVDFKKLEVEFHIYGAGMDEEHIKRYIQNHSDCQIFYHGSKSASAIKEELVQYDFSLVALKSPIYGAVPSKIFELAQLGIPILFHGNGEGAKIVESENIGFCSSSNDFLTLEENIKKAKNLSVNEYSNFSEVCLSLHEKKYRFDFQLKRIKNLI